MIADYKKKIKKLEKDGTWVTDEFIQAAAYFYERPIVIVAWDNKNKSNIFVE